MKKLIFVFALIFGVMFTSCGNSTKSNKTNVDTVQIDSVDSVDTIVG